MPEQDTTRIVVGIDTHADTHHVAVITEYGRPVADQEFPTTATGYRDIVSSITAHGDVLQVGMEGTGTYGAALTTALQAAGMVVIEVNRPNRQQRRLKGKTDSLDAYRAAQSVVRPRHQRPYDGCGSERTTREPGQGTHPARRPRGTATTIFASGRQDGQVAGGRDRSRHVVTHFRLSSRRRPAPAPERS